MSKFLNVKLWNLFTLKGLKTLNSADYQKLKKDNATPSQTPESGPTYR